MICDLKHVCWTMNKLKRFNLKMKKRPKWSIIQFNWLNHEPSEHVHSFVWQWIESVDRSSSEKQIFSVSHLYFIILLHKQLFTKKCAFSCLTTSNNENPLSVSDDYWLFFQRAYSLNRKMYIYFFGLMENFTAFKSIEWMKLYKLIGSIRLHQGNCSASGWLFKRKCS